MATNVIIPIDHAGIGDAIAIKNGETGEDKSHFICVVGSTVSATAPTGYTWYGSVYGREKGGLMIRSFKPTTDKWASTTAADVSVSLDSTKHANVIANTITTSGLQRNGKPCYNNVHLCMSVQRMKEQFGSSTSTALNPTCPYTLGTASLIPMSETNFNNDTSKAKTIYGTYENYLAQMLPIMKGSNSNVFSKRCGKRNTYEMGNFFAADGYHFPAAGYCYDNKVSDENPYHWWLPDMYEIAVMMSDNSFDKCQYAHSIIGGNTAREDSRWSSVRSGATAAWYYLHYGFSNCNSFSHSFTVCPVTLIAL